jgi:hypothetical protein
MDGLALFAQHDIGRLAIYLIVIAAIAGIVVVVLNQMGITIPPAVVKVMWIIAAAVLGIIAIRFLLSI